MTINLLTAEGDTVGNPAANIGIHPLRCRDHLLAGRIGCEDGDGAKRGLRWCPWPTPALS